MQLEDLLPILDCDKVKIVDLNDKLLDETTNLELFKLLMFPVRKVSFGNENIAVVKIGFIIPDKVQQDKT